MLLILHEGDLLAAFPQRPEAGGFLWAGLRHGAYLLIARNTWEDESCWLGVAPRSCGAARPAAPVLQVAGALALGLHATAAAAVAPATLGCCMFLSSIYKPRRVRQQPLSLFPAARLTLPAA